MKYFTYIETIEPQYGRIIEQNKEMLGDDFSVFRSCPWEIEKGNDPRYKSDVARVMWLRENPTWTWIDADALVKVPLVAVPGKIGMLCSFGEYEPAVMVGGGESSVFDDILSCAKGKVGFLQQWSYSHRAFCVAIPKGSVDHKGMFHRVRKNK